MTAREAGLPQSRLDMDTTEERDARARRGRSRRAPRRHARAVAAGTAADAKRLALPQLQPAATRAPSRWWASRCPSRVTTWSRSSRAGSARPCSTSPAPMYVRTRRAGHQPRRALQAGAREQPGLGDHARPRQARWPAPRWRCHDCHGKRLWSGRTDASGLAAMPPGSSAGRTCSPASRVFVTPARPTPRARQADMAFVFSELGKGIEPWRFNVPPAAARSPTCARTRCSTARCCAPARRCR
jgi:hypothetical protein